jgi:serralysin
MLHAMDKPVWTIDQIVANFLQWNSSWTYGSTVSYSFLTALPAFESGDPNYAGFNAFSAAQQAAVTHAFELYADITNLKFVHATDSVATDGRITFGNSTTMPDYVWGWGGSNGSYIGGGMFSYSQGGVWVNSDGSGTYADGTYDFTALLHEIGHTLGLPHPGAYNADGSEITYDNSAEYQQDSRQYTIMSYFDASSTGANHLGYYASTPLLHDVLALQALYGANYGTRAGDTTYGFHSNAGRAEFDFNSNAHPVIAIWDGGGEDTIDLSGYTMHCRLDLHAGAFSDVGGMTDNVAVCYNVTIEHGVGSQAADTIISNAADNVLRGMGGDDVIILTDGGADVVRGGTGNDTFRVHQQLIDSDQLRGGRGYDTVVLQGHADSLTFSDTMLAHVERLNLAHGFSYDLTMSDGNVAAHARLLVDGSHLGSHDQLIFDGSKEADGTYRIAGGPGTDRLTGGAGNDVLRGGLGADTLVGGGGHDRFVFHSAAESSGDAIDTIIGFNARVDRLVFGFAVDGIDTPVRSAMVQSGGETLDAVAAANFSADTLHAHHAAVLHRGVATFLVVDANGIAGYQTGQDVIIHMMAAWNLDHLSTANFG